MNQLKRRAFIQVGTSAVAFSAFSASSANPLNEKEIKSTVIVVHGEDIPKMVEAGIAEFGGWDKLFKPGMKVAIKPNIAWKSTPEEGGNTHPDLVKAFVLAAESKKVAKISLPENPCHPDRETFPTSGIREALEGTSARLYRPRANDYELVDIPSGRICKTAEVAKDILEADCLINMPVAKHHSGAVLTLSLKNLMGAVSSKTRRSWHRNGLHQCIVDFNSFVKSTLVVMDATRILMDHGPQGPGKLGYPHQIIISTDPVAADAYATTLFHKKPTDVPYIHLAEQKGLGCADLTKIKIVRIEV